MTTETATETIAVVKPTPKEIDRLIVEYASAQKTLLSAQTISSVASAAAGKLKAQLTLLVEAHGVLQPSGKTKRLEGLRNAAKTTTGTTVSVAGAAVENFKTYLDKSEMPDLVERFFAKHVSYSLVAGPSEVLATLSLGERIRTKMASLLGLCNKVTTKNPSLSIEVIEAMAPAKAA